MIAFALLGFVFGVLFDLTEFLNALFGIKFVLDFLMMCVFGVAFFVFLLAYNNGEIRWYYFAVNFAAFLLYYYTLHNLFGKRLCALAKKINNSVKNSAKKLKIGKKSFKKLLHLHK